jgi:tetratricopeptide (TPR) repeat protein
MLARTLILSLSLTIFITFLRLPVAVAKDDVKWQGSIPAFAQDEKHWEALIDELTERKMHYGALAAASRMLVFFTDLTAKEFAYKTIIKLIDEGYPFSTRPLFTAGDIDPQDPPDFANSYNFYKGILAEEKGMNQWADHYFVHVDKENFPKYLFYSALKAYQNRDVDRAQDLLKKILTKKLEPTDGPFIEKVARTLARIYFESEQYDKSLDIYQNFLLKLNPIHPADWVEGAWNLYYLKKYDAALGLLYNLEAKSAFDHSILEKYVIRALVYQAYCSTGNMDQLLKSFDRDLGKTITAIKRGETFNQLPRLKTIEFAGNTDYNQALTSLKELRGESHLVRWLPRKVLVLADYLYTSEMGMWKSRATSLEDSSMANVAMYVVNMSESLRFLKFDVARGKFNTDAIFQPTERSSKSLLEGDDVSFQIHWLQKGDFWRDEREDYKGVLKNRCSS